MEQMMKAAVLYGDADIRYEDIPIPPLEPGMVRVRVRMSGICGSDIPRVLAHGAFYYPIVLGHEFAGEVEAIGDGVDTVAVGDRVAGVPLLPCMACEDCERGNYASCRQYSFIGSKQQGSFAETVTLPARNVVKIADEVPFEQAVLFEPATVALHGILHAAMGGGQTVAVLGCGTVGMFALQFARIFGASQVVACDVDDERLALAGRLGADQTINSHDPEFLEKVHALTGGRGFPYVFETAGQPETMNMAFTLAATKASVCFIGTPHVDLTFPPDVFELMNRKEFRLTGSWMSYSAPFPGREWPLVAHYFATGQLRYDRSMIFRKMPLSKANEAFELFKTPGLVRGKILLCDDGFC